MVSGTLLSRTDVICLVALDRVRRDADDRTITRPDMQTWLLSVVLGTYNMMVLLARGR